MLPPLGLYVTKTLYDEDKTSPTYGCTLVWWGEHPKPEAFNPYYTWYLDNRCVDCDEPVVIHKCSKPKEKHHGEGQNT